MKKIFLATLLTVAAYSVNAQTTAKKPAVPVKKTTATVTKTAPKPVAKPAPFKNKLDSASYAFGFSMASQLKAGGLTSLNYDQMIAGLKSSFTNTNPALTEQQCQEVITSLFQSFSAKREEMDKEKYAGTINQGKAFLAQNKTKPNIKTTASGLQYEVLTEGAGVAPLATDKVTVNYKGTLLDGTQFDSSYDRGQPTSFGLNQVIPGWTEGLQLMKPGAKYRFWIPYNLAYGSRDAGQIKPYSTLIFEVELIKVGDE